MASTAAWTVLNMPVPSGGDGEYGRGGGGSVAGAAANRRLRGVTAEMKSHRMAIRWLLNNGGLFVCGIRATSQIRTGDPQFTKLLLYQLS